MAVKKTNQTTKRALGAQTINLTVNGQVYALDVGGRPGGIEPFDTLSHTLRGTLGLTGTKISCDNGACGACTVIMDGKAVLSCKILTVECDGKRITTIEGLRNPETGELDPLQKAFVDHTAFQCGFCTPGMIMTSKALLNENPHPTEEEVKEALSGNFCRCVSHYHVLRAVMSIADKGR
jgi:aerobic-type carbon monoxide dehydrogenase small subunit (CoxS/CutS family)